MVTVSCLHFHVWPATSSPIPREQRAREYFWSDVGKDAQYADETRETNEILELSLPCTVRDSPSVFGHRDRIVIIPSAPITKRVARTIAAMTVLLRYSQRNEFANPSKSRRPSRGRKLLQ